MRSFRIGACLLCLLLPVHGSVLHAQQAGEQVTIATPTTEDQYLAGRSVNVLAPVNGDLVTAGQRVTVEQPVSDDVIAAGERIAIRAGIGDDVRLAGRQVDLAGAIADDAVVAGETVTLAPGIRIGNRFWVAGRLVEVGGEVGGELRAAGQSIVISGSVGGDAILLGEEIEILPNARIDGNLVYRSNQEAIIADGAVIAGSVERKPLDMPDRPEVPMWPGALGTLLSLLVCLGVLYWLFPSWMRGTDGRITGEPFRALGIGLVVVLVMPVLAILLLVTVLGIPLGLLLLLLYPVILFIGFAAGIHWLGTRLLFLAAQVEPFTRLERSLGVLAALIIFVGSQFIPLLGSLVFVFLLLAGVGAMAVELRRRLAVIPVTG